MSEHPAPHSSPVLGFPGRSERGMLSVTGSGGKTVASHDKFRAADSVGGGWGDSRAFRRILVVACVCLLRMTGIKTWQFFN